MYLPSLRVSERQFRNDDRVYHEHIILTSDALIRVKKTKQNIFPLMIIELLASVFLV